MTELNHITKIEITPTAPFNFDATFFKPDHFTTDDHEWISGIRWQTLTWQNEKLGLKFINAGTVELPKVCLEIYSAEPLSEDFVKSLVTEMEYRYNLQLDLREFYGHFAKHENLSKVIKNMYGMRPGHPSSLYEYLIIGIVLQNASVRRSIQMFKNLLSTYGTELEFDGKKLLCLWNIGDLKNVAEDELRALKIGYRAKSILKIDQQFRDGLIDEDNLREEDLETQRKMLLALYGVGPATVWYLLFDVFHHWEVFDHISPWEQKIYSKLFFDKDPTDPVSIKKLLKFINQFKEYKHLAVHYCWEDLFWRRFKGEHLEWLEKEIRT